MRSALLPLLYLALPACAGVPNGALGNATESVIYAADFGMVGDGATDDGPALQEAVQALIGAPKPARLVFDPQGVYYLKTGPDTTALLRALRENDLAARHAAQNDTYMVRLHGAANVTIDGRGATFLIDAREGVSGFASVESSEDVTLRDLSIDYHPLPFADGLVVAKDAEAGHVDVEVFEEFDMPPLGGPSGLHDEQSYFGMAWREGPHGLLSRHYWLGDLREAWPGSAGDRVVRAVYRSPRPDRDEGTDGVLELIEPGSTVLSIPVRGIAHRGGREVFRIVGNTDVSIEHVNVWSAPWFVFGLKDNHGDVALRDVQVRPRPGTRRYTSAWRDAIHVTANHARLLFERIHLEGMNDDAFNIKTLHSRVTRVVSPTAVEVAQVFPLSIVPWRVGDILEAYGVPDRRLAGNAEIVGVSGDQETEWGTGHPRAPVVTIELAAPLEGLAVGDLVWNASSANTNTVIRDSVIRMSSRLQSSVTIENCDITALAWFHGGGVEGPIPSHIVVRDSRIRLGRGNPHRTLIFNSALMPEPPVEPVIRNVLVLNNEIDGAVSIEHAEHVALAGNRFLDTGRSRLRIANARNVLLQDNLLGDEPLYPAHVAFADPAVRAETTVRLTAQGASKDLMKPFAHWYALDRQGRRVRYSRLPEALRPVHAGTIDMDGAALEAYRVPVPSAGAYQGLLLDEGIAPGYDTLEFVTWLPEAGSGPVLCAVAVDGDERRVYEARLVPGSSVNHRVTMPPQDDGDGPFRVLLSFTREDGEGPETTLYLGRVRLLPGR